MKISVVIPLYNKKDTIERALRSVLNQKIQPDEIIVINDGSTDGSEKAVESLTISNLRLIHQDNAGVSAARNRGIEEAKNEWIAFLDADDEWKTGYLDCIHSLNENYPGCGILATAYYLGIPEGDKRTIRLRKVPFEGEHGLLSNYFKVACYSHPPVCSSAVCINKKLLQEVGGFPVGIKSGEDLLTWARLVLISQIAYSLQPLSVFWHDSYSLIPTRNPDPEDKVGRAFSELKDNVSPHQKKFFKRYVAHWYKMRANIYLRFGDRRSIGEIYKALRFHPTNYKLYIFMLLNFMPVSLRLRILKAASSQ